MTRYKATETWNAIIEAFRSKMPVGRHRRYMRVYNGCFVASEAVDWLHVELQNNPNIRPRVTRAQTIQLLQKLHHAQVFEDVRGIKYDKEEFADNGRLLRFVLKSPKKPSARQPLSTNLVLMNTPASGDRDKPKKADSDKITLIEKPASKTSECTPAVPVRDMTPQEIQTVWKSQALHRLQTLLSLSSLEALLDPKLVLGQHVRHNMTNINKMAWSTTFPRKVDQLPQWMLNAMRTLAHWPEPVMDGLTYYPNFEQTVFSLIREHFQNYEEPLLTFAFYELFIKTFVCAETGSLPGIATDEPDSDEPEDTQRIRQSVENLMLDLTLCEEDGDTEVDFKPYHTMPALRSPGTKQPIQRLFPQQPNTSDTQPSVRRSYTSHIREPQRSVMRQHSAGSPDEVFASSVCAPVCQRPAAYSDPPPMNPDSKPPVPAGGPSLWSVESQNLSRCLSLNDVNAVEPFVENELARQERVLSWVNTHSQDVAGLELRPPTPPPRTSASQRAMKRQTSQQTLQNTDHAYCSSNRLTQSSRDVRPPSSLSPTDPPPYIPPPSYRSLYYAKPEASEVVDFAKPGPWYETAALQTRPGSTNSYDTPNSEISNPSSAQSRQSSSSIRRSNTFVRQSSARMASSERPRSLRDSQRAFSKSTASLSTSYRMAMGGSSELTPEGSSIFSVHRDENSGPEEVLSPEQRVEKSLQVCCLFLPPANRRRLHLLLRLMWRITNNTKLKLQDDMDNRQLVLKTFSHCILRGRDQEIDPELTRYIVAFLMDHHQAVLLVPDDLRRQVEGQLKQRKQSQVSVTEYENQRLSSSQRAIQDLLDDIVKDTKLARKDKQKRLKKFQEVYPDIYKTYFARRGSAPEAVISKPTVKVPMRPRSLKQKSMRF